jgi:hypothetical protein
MVPLHANVIPPFTVCMELYLRNFAVLEHLMSKNPPTRTYDAGSVSQWAEQFIA